MNYQGGRYGRERSLRKRKRILGITLIIILVVVFGSGISKGLLGIGSGIWSFFERTEKTVLNTGMSMYSKQELILMIDQYKKQQEEQVGILEKIQILEEENKQLRRIATDPSIIPANVFRRPPDTLYDTLYISIGLRQGVEKGDIVMASSDVILGEISQALNDFSIVELYSSSGVETSGILFGANIPIRITGQGGGMFLSEVMRDIEIERGDVIGLSRNQTPVLGVVEEVVFSPQDPFKKVYIRSPINIYEVTALGVRKEI
jgi:cell shape-determining protein MreC